MSRRSSIAVWVLFGLALAVRVAAAQHARFVGDEADQWSHAVQIARLEYFPSYGLPISGSPARTPGPAFEYLMAIPQLLGSSPWLATYFVVALNLVALGLGFALARRFGGTSAGVFFLLMGAFSPWVVASSDKIWSANLLPFWGTLTLYSAVQSSTNPRWQAALVFLAGTLPQVHLSAPALWVGCLVWLILSPPPRIRLAWIAVGVAGSALAYAPMIAAELASGFANTKAILNQSGGSRDAAYVWTLPLRMLATLVGQGTGENAYYMFRGYWGGYDGLRMLGTPEGRAALRELYGASLGFAAAVSVGLAVWGWIYALKRVLMSTAAALRAGDRAFLSEGERFTVALVAALLAAAGLMMSAQKEFYPHYLAILVPTGLWPLAHSASLAWRRTTRRVPLGILFAVSVVSMFINGARYYREVDALNGLAHTLGMVQRVLAEKGPVEIRFEGFNNLFAWQRLSEFHFKKALNLRRGAATRFRVRNRAPHQGSPPDDAERFGPILLERTVLPDAIPSESIIFRGLEDWRAIQVGVVDGSSGFRGCSLEPQRGRCVYGPEGWQWFGPRTMTFAGFPSRVLFLHPMTDRTVRASIPIPASARRGRFAYGLTDGAVRSNNLSPVSGELRQDSRRILRFDLIRQNGLRTRNFTLTSTSPLTLEIRTPNDGARIFGFDIELAR